MWELEPNDGRKSFYGKARVEQSGDLRTLYSYGAPVCSYNLATGVFKRLWGGYSATTMRHVNAFNVDCGGVIEGAGGKAWWESLEVEENG